LNWPRKAGGGRLVPFNDNIPIPSPLSYHIYTLLPPASLFLSFGFLLLSSGLVPTKSYYYYTTFWVLVLSCLPNKTPYTVITHHTISFLLGTNTPFT
jgi:hypothetical protein